MLVLENINIDKTSCSFFNNNFKWDNIPQFSVIGGINGSGKTKLLNNIFRHIEINNKKENCFYIRNDHKPSNILEFDLSKIQENNNNIIYNVKSIKESIVIDNNQRNRIQTNSPHFKYVEALEKNYDKNITEILDAEIENFLYSKIDQDINNLKIVDIIIRYREIKQKIELEAVYQDISLEKRREFINNKLNKIFGTTKDPTEEINELFGVYGFGYTLNFDKGRIFFNNFNNDELGHMPFSSGESIILEVILWGYSIAENLINNSYKKLLLIDEFDAHLNPALSKIFIEIVKSKLVKNLNMQVIMTSHSPSTFAYCNDGEIFWIENKIIKPWKKEKIIEVLTPGILTFQKDKLFLLTDKSYIIITEGTTDIDHFKIATKELGLDDKILNKFEFISASGDKGKDWFNILNNSSKTIITIFDYDKTGITAHNGIVQRHGGNSIGKNINNELIHFVDKNKNYSILIPRNFEDYHSNSFYGHHPIELLYDKKSLIEFKKNALNELDLKNKNTLSEKFYWNIDTRNNIKEEGNFYELNMSQSDKEEFVNYVGVHSKTINFERFKIILDFLSKI